MIVDVSSIQMDVCKEKLFDFSYTFDSELISRIGLVETEPINVSGKIFKEESLVYVVANYFSRFHFLCDRCLDDVFIDIKGDFKTLIVTSIDDEDNGYYLEGKLLNIDNIVTEEIINNIPYSVLCNDGCLGLCSNCGCNLNHEDCNCDGENLDPRFQCLKNLLN